MTTIPAPHPVSTSTPPPPRRHRATGPNPGVLATVSLTLTLASLAATGLLTGGMVYVSPFASTGQVVRFYQDHGSAVAVSAMLLLGSAVPLGIYAATAYTRLLRLGVRVPGPSIGFAGGVLASALLMLSAITSWTAGRPELGGNSASVRALAFLAFLTGGVGYVVGLGLLVAGIAVPVLVLRLVPRWLGWTGLAIAVLAEVAFLAMAVQPLQVLLPLCRYGGLLWLITVGFLLPTSRPSPTRDPR
jgi:hypothetical protein